MQRTITFKSTFFNFGFATESFAGDTAGGECLSHDIKSCKVLHGWFGKRERRRRWGCVAGEEREIEKYISLIFC